MCDMAWYKKMTCDSTMGKCYMDQSMQHVKIIKMWYIYGTQAFCTSYIKYPKPCSTFSQLYSKSLHPYCNEYIIVSNPTQSNNFLFTKLDSNIHISSIYAWMAIKDCTMCDEGQSTFNYIIYQFLQT
jgi:hypothetical protein